MKNKIKKKFLWLEVWDIKEQEAWFSDEASKGWKLIGIGRLMAKFEKCEPQKVNYRCDVFKLNDQSEDNRIEFYQEAGWEHVASRGFLQIFRETQAENPIEIHTDALEHAETLSILKKDITMKGVPILLLSIFMLVLQTWSLLIDFVDNYLNGKFIDYIMYILMFLSINYTMVNGIFHLSKLKKKLKSGRTLEHELNFHKKIKRNKMVRSSCIFIVSIWALLVFSNLIMILSKDRFPEIPSGDLPIIQLSDILEDLDNIDGEGRSPLDHYTVKSSILVPKQYELLQQVEVPGEDKGPTFSPTILSYGYEVRNEWLAKRFLHDLKNKSSDDNENYRLEESSEFDELWISKEDFRTAFIARIDNIVYHVEFFGMEPKDEVLKKSLVKINNLK
ncbi:DUF2812 domain-containing protein [Neobacillus sp. FSL H8-0543]|uniref:DUF2812 domain-containing protein n=1 Tax=Neobacillus sp. FSL H8-0543 TaxID=2954672 RepID=UPI0031581278